MGFLTIGNPSCGSWSGNPPSGKIEMGTAPVEQQGTVDIAIQGTGASLRVLNNTLSVTDKNGAAAGQIILTSVQLNVSSITVRRDSTDTAQRPVLTGPFAVDLLTNSITPAVGKLTLPVGDYKDLRMNLYKPATGSSVVLTGTYIAADQSRSYVKIALDAQDELSFMQDTDAVINVVSGQNTAIAVRFELDKWFDFKGKDSDLSVFAGQDITIDAAATGSAQVLRQTFLNNVKTATDFDKLASPSDDKGDQDNDSDSDKDDRGIMKGPRR